MNCAQVRIQMESYRTGGEDTLSPVFREMQEHLQVCMACRERLTRIQSIDHSIGRVMRSVQAPEGLKDAILGGLTPTTKRGAWSGWFFRRAVFAMGAAAVFIAALVLGRAGMTPSPEKELLNFFIGDTRSHSELDARITDAVTARAWFHEQQGLDIVLPSQLRDNPSLIGCRTLVFDGKPVAFLCLEQGSRVLSLYAFPQGSLKGSAFAEDRAWEISKGGWIARGWSEGDMTYVVTLPGDASDLEQFLAVS